MEMTGLSLKDLRAPKSIEDMYVIFIHGNRSIIFSSAILNLVFQHLPSTTSTLY